LEELLIPSAMVAPPTSSDPAIAEAKRQLRTEMIARRKRLADTGAGPALARSVASLGPFRQGAAVAGFHPMPPEIDVLPALARFAAAGHAVGLPVVVGRDRPLVFRAWTPGAPLERGVLGIPFPPATCPEMVPEVLLVPLLAFDRRGQRLGYGGGYYDRTLAGLRATGPVFAIGVGFAFQEVDAVPHAAIDRPVDAIATEAWAERIA
jgi:5-formyltetrahydrofolate cyclo-ligase